MPKPFPASEEEYTPNIKKRMQRFIKKLDDRISERGRYLWFTDKMRLICRGNEMRETKAEAVQYFADHDRKKGWNGRWVIRVKFRAWTRWKDIFDEDRGPLEIQADRLVIQNSASKKRKYSFGASSDDRSGFIDMFYRPDEAHRFKIMHLKHMGEAVLKGQYATSIVTTYSAKDFRFIE